MTETNSIMAALLPAVFLSFSSNLAHTGKFIHFLENRVIIENLSLDFIITCFHRYQSINTLDTKFHNDK